MENAIYELKGWGGQVYVYDDRIVIDRKKCGFCHFAWIKGREKHSNDFYYKCSV